MTSAPLTLTRLMAYWTSQGGVNLGIVGDQRHVATGTSYHLAKGQLRPDAYSIQTARDKAGLSTYASACDFGKLDGSLANLQKFSNWFVSQCRTNAPDTRDVREFIYSPDGVQVLRWDRERGVGSPPRDGEADFTHRTHSHISFYRDSRARDQRPVFRRYFEPVVSTHTLHIAHGALVRAYAVSSRGCILKVNGKYGVDTVWKLPDSKAPCMAPVARKTCDGQSQSRTVRVTDGGFKGKTIGLNDKVTVTTP